MPCQDNDARFLDPNLTKCRNLETHANAKQALRLSDIKPVLPYILISQDEVRTNF